MLSRIQRRLSYKLIYSYYNSLADRPAVTQCYQGDLGREGKGKKYSNYRNLSIGR